MSRQRGEAGRRDGERCERETLRRAPLLFNGGPISYGQARVGKDRRRFKRRKFRSMVAVRGRVVVTADLDYPRLLALERADSPAIILFRGGSYSDAAMLGLLDRVLASSPAPALERSITVIDRHRVRRHTLPISE